MLGPFVDILVLKISSQKNETFDSVKILGKFKCKTCGCVQNGVSEKDAVSHVEALNLYIASVSTKEREEWYGTVPISITRYMRCFYCDEPNEQFELVKARGAQAMTNQPIVVPKPPPKKA
jgi:hypothetical protein